VPWLCVPWSCVCALSTVLHLEFIDDEEREERMQQLRVLVAFARARTTLPE
jgi:hypothetical protein